MAKISINPLNPRIKVYDPISDINEKFDFYIKIVIGVLLVAIITMMFMVTTLIVDSFHFNSATYKEYSDKINTRDDLIDSNKKLLEMNKELVEINKQNQKIIQSFSEKSQ